MVWRLIFTRVESIGPLGSMASSGPLRVLNRRAWRAGPRLDPRDSRRHLPGKVMCPHTHRQGDAIPWPARVFPRSKGASMLVRHMGNHPIEGPAYPWQTSMVSMPGGLWDHTPE